MSEPLFIIGCGGFGREVFVLVEALRVAGHPWEVAGFVDDAPSEENLARVKALNSSYVGTVATLARGRERFAAVVAIGDPGARVAVVTKLAAAPVTYPTLVHPSCTVGTHVTLGEGTIIAAGARLSTNIALGVHVHVDQNVTIGHDSQIASFARLNPQACISGSVLLGERVVVGAGATILQGLSVEPESIVGAAACVVRSVPGGVTVKGVPAA